MATPRLDIYSCISKNTPLKNVGEGMGEYEYAIATGYASFHESVARLSVEAAAYGIIESRNGLRYPTRTFQQYLRAPGSVDIRWFVFQHSKIRDWWKEAYEVGDDLAPFRNFVPGDYVEAFRTASILCGFHTGAQWDFDAMRQYIQNGFSIPKNSTSNPAQTVSLQIHSPSPDSLINGDFGATLTLRSDSETEPNPYVLDEILNREQLTDIVHPHWSLTFTKPIQFGQRRPLHDWAIRASYELIRMRSLKNIKSSNDLL